MMCKARHILFVFLALFSLISSAQNDQEIQDSIAQSFEDVYKYKKSAQITLAIKEMAKVLRLSDSIKDVKERENIKAHLTLLRTELELEENYKILDTHKIEEILKTPLEILQQSNDSLGIGHHNTLRALSAIKNNSFTEATNYLNQADSYFQAQNTEEIAYKTAYYQGIQLIQQQNYERAVSSLEKALPLAKVSVQPKYISAKIHIKIAEAHTNLKNYAEAKTHAELALEIGDRNQFPVIRMESSKILAKIYYETGDLANAYDYQNQFIAINEFLNNQERLKNIANANAFYDEDFKNRLITELLRENRIESQKGERNKFTSILSSALLIIISLLTISLYRNNQIKVKTNNLLLKKNYELQLAKDKAEKAMKAKAQFLSTVTHELRTPLYAVTGLTHLLLEENPSESQKEHLKSLKFSGDYLLTFINDILQVNKIEARKLAVEIAPLQLKKILKDVVNSLTQTSKENNNQIALDIDERIPDTLMGDSLKLSQVFINLISNALKFTKNGDVTITAETIKDSETTQTIQFKISDTGIGISQQMQENIFDSFSQGSVQINRKYGGTGLGLTIVKSLLELLGSNITLDSKLGEGSTFMFTLRFDKVASESSDIVVTEEKTDLKERRLKVLLVEDNKINQVITKKIIAKQNMTCDIADDGYQAIDFARSNRYDFILMDIHMPGISGIEATKEIRKFDVSTPIVALTAISLDENKDQFLSDGFNEVISKPFDPEIFYKKISHLLS